MIQSVFELRRHPGPRGDGARTEMVGSRATRRRRPGHIAGGAQRAFPHSGDRRDADDIVGVVYLKDLVQRTYYSCSGACRDTKVTEVMRHRCSSRLQTADDLLNEMQRDRNHMALLVDEYGRPPAGHHRGRPEEIVGEIADEYDTDEVALVEELGDNRFRVSARLPIEDLGESLRHRVRR